MYVGMDPMRRHVSDACCDGRRITTFLVVGNNNHSLMLKQLKV